MRKETQMDIEGKREWLREEIDRLKSLRELSSNMQDVFGAGWDVEHIDEAISGLELELKRLTESSNV